MPKRPPEAEWERRAKVALSEGDGLSALRILETVPFHAAALPGLDVRERCSARRHARIILEHAGQDVHGLDDCFAVPVVFVFAGLMLDSPHPPARERRFPPALEPAVASEIKRALSLSVAAIGFATAAAGSDILFLEQMKTLAQAYHILLSGPQAEFKERSVNYAGADWGERFQTVLDSAKSVEEASSHHPADNSVAYWYASRLLSCRALLQAQQLNLDLVALAVWNGKPGFGRGGTASFIEFWNRDFHKPLGQTKPKLEIIRLDSLLRDQGPIQEITVEPAIYPDSAAGTDSNVQRDFRAILVGNVVGFETLTEEQLPLFCQRFVDQRHRGITSRILSRRCCAATSVGSARSPLSTAASASLG